MRLQAQAAAEAQKIRAEAELKALRESEEAAKACAAHPALLRLRELETLKDLAQSANARIYVDLKKRDDDGGEWLS